MQFETKKSEGKVSKKMHFVYSPVRFYIFSLLSNSDGLLRANCGATLAARPRFLADASRLQETTEEQ